MATQSSGLQVERSIKTSGGYNTPCADEKGVSEWTGGRDSRRGPNELSSDFVGFEFGSVVLVQRTKFNARGSKPLELPTIYTRMAHLCWGGACRRISGDMDAHR